MRKPKRVHEKFKLIRGVYLTAIGQENRIYYFKISNDFEVEVGDVCLTFYQNPIAVYPLPTLIRVDGILTDERLIKQALEQEKRQSYSYLPIVKRYKGNEWHPKEFFEMMRVFEKWQDSIQRK